MRLALVNPFDPPPGDDVRPGRYASFCQVLAGRGHDVTWYSSDFSHALKARRNGPAIAAACAAQSFKIQLCPTRPYEQNVGMDRLASHRELARTVIGALDSDARPDVVIVSTPPPVLAAGVAQWAAARSCKVVVDVQDLWPETFVRLWPAGLKWINRIAGAGMAGQVRRAYEAADAAIATTRAFADHFRIRVGAAVPCSVLHLGVDLAEFDANVKPRSSLDSLVGPLRDRHWVFVGGSMGLALNWNFMLDLAGALAHEKHVGFIVMGTGPAQEHVQREVRRRALGNVLLLGQQPYGIFCTAAAASTVGLNHYRRDSSVYFPNRVLDYFAAGIRIVNTIRGELADLIEEHRCGVTVDDTDASAAAKYVLDCAQGPLRTDLPEQGRGPWTRQFDREAISRELAGMVESLSFQGADVKDCL